jgi:hypothetical protein
MMPVQIEFEITGFIVVSYSLRRNGYFIPHQWEEIDAVFF